MEFIIWFLSGILLQIAVWLRYKYPKKERLTYLSREEPEPLTLASMFLIFIISCVPVVNTAAFFVYVMNMAIEGTGPTVEDMKKWFALKKKEVK